MKIKPTEIKLDSNSARQLINRNTGEAMTRLFTTDGSMEIRVYSKNSESGKSIDFKMFESLNIYYTKEKDIKVESGKFTVFQAVLISSFHNGRDVESKLMPVNIAIANSLPCYKYRVFN